MKENNKIDKIQVIYNPEEKKYEKAFVSIGGKVHEITDNSPIISYLKDLKQQENKPLNKMGTKKLETVFSNSPVARDKEEAWKNASRISTAKLNKKNKYDGKKTKGNFWKKAKKTVAGIVADAAVISLASCGINTFSNKDKIAIVREIDSEDDNLKNNPESWDDYMSSFYNENAEQKKFAKSVMENQIEKNIKTKTIDENEITYGLTPEQAMAFSIYYNSNLYSNEKMLAILGDYSITGNSDASKNLVNQVNDATEMIRLSWAIADNKEEMIVPEVEDEEVQALINKYIDLIAKYKSTSDTKSKKSVKTEVEEALKDDFIDAENGVVNLQDHPSAHIILNTVPAVFSTINDALDEDINKILVGTEANYDIDLGTGKSISIPETGGLVDDPCAVYIARFDNFEDYRSSMMIDKTFADRTNASIYNEIEYLERELEEASDSFFSKEKVSELEKDLELKKASLTTNEWDIITKDTYEYDYHDEHDGVIIPIMDDYVKTLGLDNLEDMQDIFRQAVIGTFAERKTGGAFNPHTNPAGGKKGDTYTEYLGRQSFSSSSELINNYNASSAEIKDAEEKASEAAGAITEEQAQKELNEINSAIQAMGRSPYYHFKEKGASAGDLEWASSPYEAVRNAYNKQKTEGIKAYNILHQDGEVKEEDDNDLKHEDNPNQPNPPSESSTTDEKKDESKPSSGSTDNNGSTTDIIDDSNIPSHEDNPNQNNGGSTGGSSESQIDEDTVGGVTTDDSDVWDPSTAGEYSVDDDVAVQSSAIVDDYSRLINDIDSYIEYLENMPSYEEMDYQKSL